MKFYLVSEVECTVDGVGLLEPGMPVAVDEDLFQVYHKVAVQQANFPPSVKVYYDMSDANAEQNKEVED